MRATHGEGKKKAKRKSEPFGGECDNTCMRAASTPSMPAKQHNFISLLWGTAAVGCKTGGATYYPISVSVTLSTRSHAHDGMSASASALRNSLAKG